MKDDDPITMTSVHEFVGEYLPDGFTATFHADKHTGAATRHVVTLRDSETFRVRKVQAFNMGQLRISADDFIRTCSGGKPIMTATGVDEQTDVDRIARWGLRDLELGFLYSVKWAGNAKRYPVWPWIADNSQRYHRCALHICGKEARRELVEGKLPVDSFQRIQINGRYKAAEIEVICSQFPDHVIIAQYSDQSDHELLKMTCDNLSILVDASGGNGVLPGIWPKLETDLPVGFAGGLRYLNMREQVRRIRSVAAPGWWVDLESGLRDEEWFDLGLLEGCHRAFKCGADGPPICQVCNGDANMVFRGADGWACCGTHASLANESDHQTRQDAPMG